MSYDPNSREDCERREREKKAQEAQISLAKKMAATAAALAVQQEAHHRQLLAENREQTRRLTEQAIATEELARIERRREAKEDEERQFDHDIKWLERSDAAGRFEYLLGKVEGEAKQTLLRIAVDQPAVSGAVVDVDLMQAVTEFASASEVMRQREAVLLEMNQDLNLALQTWETAKAAHERSRVKEGVRFWGLAVGIGLPVFLVIRALSGDIDSFATFFRSYVTLVIASVILFAPIIFRDYRQDKAARATPLSARPEPPPSLAIAKEESDHARVAYESSARKCRELSMACLDKIADAVTTGIRGMAADGSLGLGLMSIVKKVEKKYPATTRVDWDQITDDFLRKKLDERLDSLCKTALASVIFRPEAGFLCDKLRASGQARLADSLRESFEGEAGGGGDSYISPRIQQDACERGSA